MDISRLVDSLRYGFPYHGDRDRDCADVLEDIGNQASISEETKSHIRSECLSQLPSEDFLCEIIDQLQGLKGLKKAEILDKIDHVVECLEDLQQCQANASAYAYDELSKL